MQKKSGFTLIEMALVLIVIGLIVGGIFLAKNMIRNAELRSIATEFQQYVSAIGQFKEKYNAMPGDFSEATTIWGAAHAVAITCTGTIATSATATCNGDGNGRIVDQSDSNTYYESLRAWQHLSNAKFIEGRYTGVAPGGRMDRKIGLNIPASKVSGAGWGLVSVTVADINSGYTVDLVYNFDNAINHVLWFGGNSSNAANNQQIPELTGAEALSIDLKLDDGLPGYGKILAQANDGGANCIVDPETYDLSTNDLICSLVFRTGF